MILQTGQQIIIIHTLPNISRSKCNQTMKFGQLIKYNRNIFLKKSSIKYNGEANPRPFDKKSKLSIYLDKCYKFVEVYQNILKLRCWPLASILYFLQNKKRFETSLPALSWHDFWRKIFLTLYSIGWPNCIAWLLLLLELLDDMSVVIICCPACHVINFVSFYY